MYYAWAAHDKAPEGIQSSLVQSTIELVWFHNLSYNWTLMPTSKYIWYHIYPYEDS